MIKILFERRGTMTKILFEREWKHDYIIYSPDPRGDYRVLKDGKYDGRYPTVEEAAERVGCIVQLMAVVAK